MATQPDPRGRDVNRATRAESLSRREQLVAAREAEFDAKRHWRRVLWALRLAPWSAVEIALAACLLLAGMAGFQTELMSALGGAIIGTIAVARVLNMFRPPDPKPRSDDS